jgi:hypothetical protein
VFGKPLLAPVVALAFVRFGLAAVYEMTAGFSVQTTPGLGAPSSAQPYLR